MAATEPQHSRSRHVNAYVKRQRRYNRLAGRLVLRERALAPLRSKVADAKARALVAYGKLTGGQIAEARRLLAAERPKTNDGRQG